jgi:hypothetical protein
MKKLLVLSALACTAASVMAQGYVTFQNLDTGAGIRSPIYLTTVGGATPSGTDTSLRAAILGGVTGTAPAFIVGSRTNGSGTVSQQGSLSLLVSPNSGNTWTTFRTGTAAGFVGVGSDSARIVPGVDFLGTAEVQVVAWNGGYNTWAQAYAAWAAGTPGVMIGASNPLTVTLPASATDPNLAKLIGLESFAMVLNTVPEPSTFALAGLGAAAMMIFRRRK